MANGKTAGNPAEKPGGASAEKAAESGAGKSSGRRNGRRGRPQGGQQNRPQGEREGGQPDRSQGGRRNVQPDKPQGERLAGRRPGSSGRSGNPARPSGGKTVRIPAFNWTWRNYTLQLSVVIIGIVVTFVGSDLISRWSRQRQVRTVMRMVVAELDVNRGHLDHCCDRLILDRQGMLMFDRYGKDVDRIPADSLECYMSMLGSTQDFRPRSDALEVLKTSGAIQSVRDDGLLMQVLACYRALEEFGREVDNYNRRKQEAMDHFLANASPELLNRYSSLGFREAWRAMLADPLCVSFVGMMANYFEYDYDDYLTGDIADCRKTIASINEKYRFERQDTQK